MSETPQPNVSGEQNPKYTESLQNLSAEDRKRIVDRMSKKVVEESELLQLMGADANSNEYALDARASESAQAVSAVSRDLHGLERPQGADPGHSSGTFNYRI